jgi:hypothetical protein
MDIGIVSSSTSEGAAPGQAPHPQLSASSEDALCRADILLNNKDKDLRLGFAALDKDSEEHDAEANKYMSPQKVPNWGPKETCRLVLAFCHSKLLQVLEKLGAQATRVEVQVKTSGNAALQNDQVFTVHMYMYIHIYIHIYIYNI